MKKDDYEHQDYLNIQLALRLAWLAWMEHKSADHLMALETVAKTLLCHSRFRHGASVMIEGELHKLHLGQDAYKPSVEEVISFLMTRLFHSPDRHGELEISRFDPDQSSFRHWCMRKAKGFGQRSILEKRQMVRIEGGIAQRVEFFPEGRDEYVASHYRTPEEFYEATSHPILRMMIAAGKSELDMAKACLYDPDERLAGSGEGFSAFGSYLERGLKDGNLTVHGLIQEAKHLAYEIGLNIDDAFVALAAELEKVTHLDSAARSPLRIWGSRMWKRLKAWYRSTH